MAQVSGGGGSGSVGMAGAVMDALSVRGQSISSGGSGESKVSSNLARDLSVRSENVVPHGAVAAHSARILTARSNTTRTKSKGEGRLFYVGNRGHLVFIHSYRSSAENRSLTRQRIANKKCV